MTGEVLSSWKEIAAYMGKGVRTVQRWEAEMGLPVRRPGPERHIVIAIPAELDAWVRNGGISRDEPVASIATRMSNYHKLLSEQRIHVERHQQHAVELARMRALMNAMMERLALNREHASRLMAECSRRVSRNGVEEQKMKQSA